MFEMNNVEFDKSCRVIIHLDLDAFYAQVEQVRLNLSPNEPVVVQQWGSLLAVNYPARKFGVSRGDTAWSARKKCPSIHIPHVETLGENRTGGKKEYDKIHQKAILHRYRVASRHIIDIISTFGYPYEKASIDEVYIDVSEAAQARWKDGIRGNEILLQGDKLRKDTLIYGVSTDEEQIIDGIQFPLSMHEHLLSIGAIIACEIRQTIFTKLKYTSSTGIANNKLVAKLASPLNKPNGQTIVAPRYLPNLLQSFPLTNVRGLGGKLGRELVEMYYNEVNKQQSLDLMTEKKDITVSEFTSVCYDDILIKRFGEETTRYIMRLCQGDDGDEPLTNSRNQLKMLSSIKQFEQPVYNLQELIYWIKILAQEIILRFEEDLVENHRVPTHVTFTTTTNLYRLQTTNASNTHWKEKKTTRQIPIIRSCTVTQLVQSVVNLLEREIAIDSNILFPVAAVSMIAKDFESTETGRTTEITQFFKKELRSQDQEVQENMPTKTVKTSANKKKTNPSISSYFSRMQQTTNTSITKRDITESSNAHKTTTKGKKILCAKCGEFINNDKVPAQEHADYHYAQELQRLDSESYQVEQRKEVKSKELKRKRANGPMDYFTKKITSQDDS